ncbi:hypothetical protein ACJ72_08635 [Emergomyces africanus]|uniref:Uncharacterized protein n=1 Tax=Emergomyces africanus TaxID=1955775 RepID=A0A1B7NK76_9EURO|nr:hypothetical protein ACJ72_08635 [Emergomyces africanus]
MARRRVNNHSTKPVDVSPDVDDVTTSGIVAGRRKEQEERNVRGRGKGTENARLHSSSFVSNWVILAIASGLFAATNGLFAKL